MSAREMAEQGIIKLLFPGGMVPWEDRHKTPEIERTISHLLDVVEGDGNIVIDSIRSPQENAIITQQIVDLRKAGYTERQIVEKTGLSRDAVHNRLERHKRRAKLQTAAPGPIDALSEEFIPHAHEAAQPPVPEAALRSVAPDHFVEANEMVTGTDSVDGIDYEVLAAPPKVEQVPGLAGLQEVRLEQSEKPQDLEQKKSPKPEKVPLTDAQKAQIMELHEKGLKNREIADRLGIRNMSQIQGTIVSRKRKESAHAAQSSDTSAMPAKDVMLLQQPANVADTSIAAPKPTEDKPAPKAIGRAELDAKIWELHKAGKTPEQISDILYAEGLYYSEKSVIIRLRSQLGNL
jgi:hypothetical protein